MSGPLSLPAHRRPADHEVRAPRADIQALRAIAVGVVVVYHFFPDLLPGGFVGVDVFFVISGFLITAHLIDRPPRSGRDLAAFWGRRIRRLLPASFLVLGTTFVLVLLLAPETVRTQTAEEIAASALYVQNWFLAGEAVDYLAADNAASPVQHFWSLSVEEQFYLFWPVLVMIVSLAVARRRLRSLRGGIGVAVVLVSVISFSASVVLTATDPGSAYFVTWTRIWELGVGALAACLFPALQHVLAGRRGLRTVLAYLGIAGIAGAAFIFSESLPFPGSVALLPVLSTALVLVAAVERDRLSPSVLMEWRPVQLVGDLSYSIYLWHWPALILLPVVLDREVRGWQKIVVLAGVVALSWATKRWVEDRFRGTRPLGRPLRRSFVFAGVGMLVFVLAAGATVHAQARAVADEQARIDALVDGSAPCFGARALIDTESCDPHGAELLTSPGFAAADRPDPYEDDCWTLADYSETRTCEYGSDAPDATRVALIGNSHAGHWLPALQEIAAERGWRITTYLISVCYTVDVKIDLGSEPASSNCLAWNRRSIADIANGGYDLVVISDRTYQPIEGYDRADNATVAQEAYGRVLDRWSDAGVPTLVLRDTPYATDLANVPQCVEEAGDDLAACDGTRRREVVDPLADAAALRSDDPNVRLLDLTDRICSADVCQSVVGGVIVYFDRGHLSATFSRTLAPDIWATAKELL
ncbi:acyltransferase family protein [Microbacterium oleivorans]|uniref:acyltransferase family protein n=1 Tax=Microbacterium oleivorans TaxID=273677 RepID=UPI000ADD14CD|nr:acyltransferase family protein [Microbacterium oleivorans]